MTRIKLIVLAVLAVFCMSAVAATAAMANEGTFVNKKGETVKGKFTGKSKVTKLESGFGTVECETDEAVGRATSTTTGEETVYFKKCSAGVLGKCTGGVEMEGKKPNSEEIYVLVGLQTRRASQPSGEVLLLVVLLQNGSKEPATEAKPFEFKCGIATVKTFGSFLVKTNTTAEKTEFTFEAKANSSHENEPKEYENEAKEKKKDQLKSNEGFGWENSGQIGSETVTFEEAGHFV